jgi:hypothetical protein
MILARRFFLSNSRYRADFYLAIIDTYLIFGDNVTMLGMWEILSSKRTARWPATQRPNSAVPTWSR